MWPPTPEQVITMLWLSIFFTGLVVLVIWGKHYKGAKQAQLEEKKEQITTLKESKENLLVEKDEQIKTLTESKDTLLASKDEQIKLLEKTNSAEAVKIIETNKILLETEIERLREELTIAFERADLFKAEIAELEAVAGAKGNEISFADRSKLRAASLSFSYALLEMEKSRDDQIKRLDEIGDETAKIIIDSR